MRPIAHTPPAGGTVQPSQKQAATLGMTAAAVLLAGSVLLSRMLGFVREAVLAYRVGVGPEADAYAAAFQIPDLLNYLLAGGALSIAFVPLYTRARARDGEDAAARLLATVLGTLGVVAVLATVVLWAFAGPLTAFAFPRFDPERHALTVRLTRIVLPAQIFFVVGGIVRAALMAHGRFGAQAAAPLVYNAMIIAGGLFLAPVLGVEGFAWGALAGAVLGPFAWAVWDARGRVRLGVRVAPGDRTFLGYLLVAAPLMLGVTLLTVDEWYDRIFGGLLETGTIAQLRYGRQLMLVPVAVVGQAIATAALPTLARLWEEGRHAELGETVLGTLRAGVTLAVLCGAAMLALAEPAVTVVYVRGAFTPADAGPVAGVLALFCLAVPGWVTQQIAVRPFYARGDTWRPMLLGTGVALAAIPLYLALGPRFGAAGLAAAGALAISANALLTLLLARRLHGAPALGPLASTVARVMVAAVPAALLARIVRFEMGGLTGALLDGAVGGLVFASVAALGILLLGDDATKRAVRGRSLP